MENVEADKIMRAQRNISCLRIAAVFLLLFIAAIDSSGQRVSFNSLSQVFEFASKNNIQLRTADARKRIAALQIQQSYSTLFPNVSLNGNYTDNIKIQPTLVPLSLFGGEPNTYSEEKFGRRYTYNANVSAQVSILDLKNWFAIGMSKYNFELTQLSFQKDKMELMEELAAAYYNYLMWQEIEKLSRQNSYASDTIWMTYNKRATEGLIGNVQLNTALINKYKSSTALQVAQANKKISLNNLRALLNLNPADSIFINDQISAIKPGPLPAERFTFSSPELQIAHIQTLLSRNTMRTLRAAFAPSLTAVYQYSSQVAGDKFLSGENANNTSQQYFGLRLSVPLFMGGYRRQQLKAGEIDYQNKLDVYQTMKNQTDINNSTMLIEYHSAESQLIDAAKILEGYQENNMHAQKLFIEGVISGDERLRVLNEYVNYQSEYLRLMSNYLVSQYRIQIRQLINFQP